MTLRPRTPRFEQVKAELTHAIINGQFAPGDRLPSLRDLCAHFGVSLVTVQRAVQELKDEEWLVGASRKGVMVSDPLPPIAHLVRLKNERREKVRESVPARNPIGPGRNGTLKCLIYDKALLPLFEWAADVYADAYAPCSLQFEVEALSGRDDPEAMRSLDADLVLVSSYAANRAANAGAITPADGMLSRCESRFSDIPPGILNLLMRDGKLWGVPLLVGGPILAAGLENCGRLGLDWKRLSSVDSLLSTVESAAERMPASGADVKLMNITFLSMLWISSGQEFSGIREAPAMMAHPAIRTLLERLRGLARSPAVVVNRFDQWELTDMAKVAVRHQPSSAFCRDLKNREGARVLPIPGPKEGRLAIAASGLCISSRSVHPFEAWEWAAKLAEAPFQARLAKLAYDIPASVNPAVREAFGKAVGTENARTLQDLIRRPSRYYGMGPEDLMLYVWEVFGNELFRFISGQNDYDRLLERVSTKTERFLGRSAPESAVPAAAEVSG